MSHGKFMNEAIILAKNAFKQGDVPVGAVIVYEGQIVGKGLNNRELAHNALAHAEIQAINEACNTLKSWRLSGCTMYVTLEPCPMCSGAIINSRIDRVVFGAYDEKAGCLGSVTSFNDLPFNHHIDVIGGYMEKECGDVLKDFFEQLRKE